MAEPKRTAAIVLNALALVGALIPTLLVSWGALSSISALGVAGCLALVGPCALVLGLPVLGLVMHGKGRDGAALGLGIASAVLVVLAWLLMPAVLFGLSGA